MGCGRPGMRAPRPGIGFRDHALGVLDRPRVDVTLRISGFFRDALPAQIDLFDSWRCGRWPNWTSRGAEPDGGSLSPQSAEIDRGGVSPREASGARQYRVFGSKPAPMVPACRPDRRKGWTETAGLRPGLSRLGLLRLWRRRRGRPSGGCSRPASPGRCHPAQPGQPRARSPRQRRLLPVRGRPRRHG